MIITKKNNCVNFVNLPDSLQTLIPFNKKGNKINIKKENKGKFTKYCNGNVTEECISRGKKSKDPKVRKRATFASNARKWKRYDGGGELKSAFDDKRNQILKRSEIRQTAGNYEDAIDLNVGGTQSSIVNGIDYINNALGIDLPTGQSNCTLTATQWVNPNIPIGRAQTIIDNGTKYGYVEIPEEHVLPGDLVIATNPNNNHHHTMLVTSFADEPYKHTFLGKEYQIPQGHPIVRYSNGSTNVSGYRNNIGLLEYVDNSHGKTDIKYYRHYDPWMSETLLPEITVTPNGSIYQNSNVIRINK